MAHASCLQVCPLVWLSLPVASGACQAAVGFTPMSMSAPGGVRGAGPAVVGPAMGPIRLGLAPAMPPILEAQGGSNHMGGEGSGSATGHVGT